MDPYLLHIFIANFLLVLVDATMGYHLAPLLARRGAEDEEEADWGTLRIRRLLSWVVALYAFFNCYAYFRGNAVFLLVVSALILLDITAQVVVRRKLRKRSGDDA